MYNARPAAYRETEVMSSTPERLIPLMYEKLLVSLKRGAMCIRNRDYEAKSENVQMALDIIYELMASLDFEQGGEIATHLSGLYAFWAREISQAAAALHPERLVRVADMVGELHESWVEAVRLVESGEALGGTPGGTA